MIQTTNSIQNAIAVLNSNNPNVLAVQKWMLLARVQRAAKLGDVDAQRFVELCEVNFTSATRH
jgi:hypothetical protein